MRYDAVIIGSGPNGLSAAIYLQQRGLSTLLLEKAAMAGGSTRTEEATLPGYLHDIGSAVHPLAAASPYMSTLPLKDFGLEWVYPELPLVHPLPDGRALGLSQSLEETAGMLGRDAKAYEKLVGPIAKNWDRLGGDLLAPLSWPANPFLLARFGLRALWPASLLSSKLFSEESTRTLFFGLAAHSGLPMTATASSAFGLVLAATAHSVGWPFPKGGAQAIPKALTAYYSSLGGEIRCDFQVESFFDIPTAKAYLFDLTPAQLLKIRGLNLSLRYREKLSDFRYGPGIFKIDFALSDPIPWKNDACRKAGTIHIGASADEIAESEAGIAEGIEPDKPYMILAQPTLFDSSRAPQGKHIAWVYCHVPNGSLKDMTEPIIRQIERLAPGFREVIIAQSCRNSFDMEQWNANLVGGDVNGGLQDIRQLFFRPVIKAKPYRSSQPDVYLCSSSTPPGGGVHGMCGFHAAKTAFSDHFK
ncbi:phytoene desaturase family protein [Roseivirga sp. BDSF3-8]|uniref:phytoene desaturase family protein n=1 Tax=Roseivirga sp. BDSF3-8 TaxID=3241598 RepID=UPI0035319BFD